VIRPKCQEGKDDPGSKNFRGTALAPMHALGSAVDWLMNYALSKVNQRET